MITLKFIDMVRQEFNPAFYEKNELKIVFLTGFFSNVFSLMDYNFGLNYSKTYKKIYFISDKIKNGISFFLKNGTLNKSGVMVGEKII